MSAATIDLGIEQFESTVSGDGVVLVDFWAEWCGPCKSFAPVFEASAEKHGDHVFAKVDTEAEQQLAGALNIQSIPTLMIFRDGVLLFSQPGALPSDALEDLIGQVEALDMDEVRAEIAAQTDGGPDAESETAPEADAEPAPEAEAPVAEPEVELYDAEADD